MSLSTTPDLSLLRIFYHLPLSDLLFRANLVCRRWNALKPEACAQRRSLTLVIGENSKLFQRDPFAIPFVNDLDESSIKNQHSNDDVNDGSSLIVSSLSILDHYIEDHHIVSKWSRVEFRKFEMTVDKINQLVAQLPNISSLAIIQDSFREPWLYHLLNIRKRELVTLKLYFPKSFWHIVFISMEPELFALINSSLPKLKSFTFYCSFYILKADLDKLDLPILSQLEEFYFYMPKANDAICKSLHKYALDNDRLKRITLQKSPMTNELITSLHPKLAEKFTHLNLKLNWQSVNLDNYLNVTTVKLGYAQLIAFNLALSRLDQLIHLNVRFRSFNSNNFPLTKSPIIQLNSVKVLSLGFSVDPTGLKRSKPDHHSYLNHCFLAVTNFAPAISLLSIRLSEFDCTDCGVTSQMENDIPLDCIENCFNESLRRFEHFRDSQFQRPLLRREIIIKKPKFYREWSL